MRLFLQALLRCLLSSTSSLWRRLCCQHSVVLVPVVIEQDDKQAMIPIISARKKMDKIKNTRGVLSLVLCSTIACHHCFPRWRNVWLQWDWIHVYLNPHPAQRSGVTLMSGAGATMPHCTGLNVQTWKPLSDWLDYTIPARNCPSLEIAKKGDFRHNDFFDIMGMATKWNSFRLFPSGQIVTNITTWKRNASLRIYSIKSILFLMDSAILYILNNHHVSAFYATER